MATYYDIFGQKVQYLSSDPSPVSAGQVWYNSSSNTGKFQGFNPGAFTSSPALNTATRAMVGSGTQTAAIKINGANPGTNYSSLVEEYNGSSWSEVNNTPTGTAKIKTTKLKKNEVLYAKTVRLNTSLPIVSVPK